MKFRNLATFISRNIISSRVPIDGLLINNLNYGQYFDKSNSYVTTILYYNNKLRMKYSTHANILLIAVYYANCIFECSYFIDYKPCYVDYKSYKWFSSNHSIEYKYHTANKKVVLSRIIDKFGIAGINIQKTHYYDDEGILEAYSIQYPEYGRSYTITNGVVKTCCVLDTHKALQHYYIYNNGKIHSHCVSSVY